MGMREVKFKCDQDCNATAEELWKIISAWERTTEFWKGTREMRKTDEGIFHVRFAFPGNAKMKLALDETGLSVTEEYLNGPFKGTKTTFITQHEGKSRLKTEWNVLLSPMLMLGRNSIKKHFNEGTQNALKRISDAAEGRS